MVNEENSSGDASDKLVPSDSAPRQNEMSNENVDVSIKIIVNYLK